MELDSRSGEILRLLIDDPTLTSKELELKLKLNRRQIGYSIKKINIWLQDNNLPEIIRTRQGRFLMDKTLFLAISEEQVEVSEYWIIPSKEQRLYLIILMILGHTDTWSLFHFTSELDVSKSTVLNDLKEVNKYLSKFNLIIHYSRKDGYVIQGDEFYTRKVLMSITTKVLDMNKGESRVK